MAGGNAGQGPQDARPLRRVTKKQAGSLDVDFKKGDFLWVKAPPYYEKEYLYEVTGAGGKLIRASLYHSPRVRKSWTKEELLLLLEMGIIRMAEAPDPADVPAAADEGDTDN